jgi:hypothetical protein
MQISSETIAARNVVFDYMHEDLPGGAGLDKTRLIDTLEEVKAGTLVNVAARVAEVVKTAVCVASSADSTHIRVTKGHLFKVGESVTDGFAVGAITVVDKTTSTAYDILTLGAALVNYGAGVVLVEVNTSAVMGEFASATVTIATGKTITVKDPSGASAGMIVSITAAGDDNLAVTYATNTLSIALAGTTATKNTPAVEIQAAVRALASGPFAFGEFVVTGDELAGSAITPATGTMAVNQPYKYLPTGLVKATVQVGDGATLYENVGVSVITRGAVRESALPYPINAALKALLPKFTFNT